MKTKYAACVLILFTTYVTNVMADSAQLQAIDPTLSFFTSLATCAPGNYTERNDLDGNVGQAWLNQIILGQDQGICNVVLSTPDSRNMNCAFPMNELTNLMDQNFLQGALDSTTDSSTKFAVKSDLLWSQLKTTYCHFADPIITQ